MKGIMRYMPAVALIALLGAGCQVEKLESYHDTTDNVYFDFETQREREKLVNLNYTFYYNFAEESHLFEIPVRISGERVDHDRYFKVLPTAEPTLPDDTQWAVIGENYELETTGVVPAGEGQGFVRVRLLNTPLQANKYQYLLRLELMAAGDFTNNFASGAPGLNVAEIRFSPNLVRPFWWNDRIAGNAVSSPMTDTSLGPWSRTANELFYAATGADELILTAENTMDTERNTLVKNFVTMMKNPSGWVGVNPGKATFTAGVPNTFKVTATGKTYYCQLDGSIMKWLGDDMAYSLYYE